MKKFLTLFTFWICSAGAFASTWYVRPDGGTRNSTNITNGQCDGTADVSYVAASGATAGEYWQPSVAETLGTTVYVPNGHYATVTSGGTSGTAITWPTSGIVSGTGGTAVYTVSGSTYPVNQHCAFNDARMLYQDGAYADGGSTFPNWGWIGTGGDTYIIRGSIADNVSYRLGWPNSVNCLTMDGANCWGLYHDQFSSGMPPPPSGTSGAHTRILGGNFGSCTAQNARTQLHGGWGVGQVLGLNGSTYVDVACLDLTDFSACGLQNGAVACKDGGGNVISDFAKNGITITNATAHITLTDIRIHGVASDGINGPPGGDLTATDIALLGNQDSGWNADNGSGIAGIGNTTWTNWEISWNGCAEEYPIVDSVPYFSCRDQGTGGYGDGWGTASIDSLSPWNVIFDQGIVSYNMQDGLDGLHIAGAGSTITITRTLAYGNEGQQFKAGGGGTTVRNNLIVGNCYAVLQNVIPGRPVPTQDDLANACRAGNVPVLVTTSPGTPTKFQDNTIFTAGNIGFEFEYATGDHGTTNVLQYNNNIFVGFLNPDNSQNPTPIFTTGDFSALTTNPGASWTNNSYFGYRGSWTCPNASESSALCVSPQLTDMTWHPYGYGNMIPASGASSVVGAGVAISGITVDYAGEPRPNPPTIGAYEPSGTPVASSPTFSPVAGTYAGAQSVTLSTATSACTAYLVWNTTNAQSGGNLTGVSATNPLTVSSSETVYAQVQGCPSFTNSSITSAAYTINPPAGGATIGPSVVFSGTVVIQ